MSTKKEKKGRRRIIKEGKREGGMKVMKTQNTKKKWRRRIRKERKREGKGMNEAKYKTE